MASRLVYLGAAGHDLLYGNTPGSGNDIAYAVRDAEGKVTPVRGTEAFPDLFASRMVRTIDTDLEDFPWDIRAIETGFLIGIGQSLLEIRNDATLEQRGRYAVTLSNWRFEYSCPRGSCTYTLELDPTWGHVAMDKSGALWCRMRYLGGYITMVNARLTPDEGIDFIWPSNFNPERPIFPENYIWQLTEPYIPLESFTGTGGSNEGYPTLQAFIISGP